MRIPTLLVSTATAAVAIAVDRTWPSATIPLAGACVLFCLIVWAIKPRCPP